MQMCVCVCVCFCVCVCLCVYPASTIILLCKNQHVFAMASSAHTHEHAPRTQTRCNSQGTKCDENVRMRTSQIPYYYLSSINTTSPHKYARAVRAHTHTHTHTHTQTHTARAYSQRVHAFLTICFFHRTHYRLRAAAHIFLPTFFFVTQTHYRLSRGLGAAALLSRRLLACAQRGGRETLRCI